MADAFLEPTDEKAPRNYHGGIAGKVWFYPYLDTATQDTPEICAAMRQMRRDPYVKTAWSSEDAGELPCIVEGGQ